MKRFFIVICIVSITSLFVFCTKKDKQEVELILLNDEVHYVDIDSITLMAVRDNYTEIEKRAAKNIITYQLINHSDKSFLFSIINDEITFSDAAVVNNTLPMSSWEMSYSIKDKKGYD